jgi:hypothetical protein
MTESGRTKTSEAAPQPSAVTLEFGGLHFEISFRDVGATLRVDAEIDGTWTEVIRFDDFVDTPHFHAPASDDPILFDRATLGEPLAWFVTEIRDHLADRLEMAGYAELVPSLDLQEITENADQLTEAMTACVPAGFVRVPGVGLQRVAGST